MRDNRHVILGPIRRDLEASGVFSRLESTIMEIFQDRGLRSINMICRDSGISQKSTVQPRLASLIKKGTLEQGSVSKCPIS